MDSGKEKHFSSIIIFARICHETKQVKIVLENFAYAFYLSGFICIYAYTEMHI